MKKTISQLFLYLLTTINSILWGQDKQSPFGVSSPMFWIEAQQTQGKLILKEHISAKILAEKPWNEASEINYNPSFSVNESLAPIQFPLSQETAEQYSIFVVYQPENQKHEQNIWTLSSNQSRHPLLMVTNHRLADYTGGQFRSYPEKITQQKVKIHYYQHYKKLGETPEESNKNTSSTLYTLSLGKQAEGLPPLNFKGNISEVIIYNRVLSILEMQQVASYLAIKYGVSLHQMAFRNYYNRKGDIIWDYKKHKSYNQNITAVGRTDLGNLHQPKSLNSNDEQVIAMELHPTTEQGIPNDFFVFWSDNGKELKVTKQREGQPKGISRVWQLDTSHSEIAALNIASNLSVISPLPQNSTEDYYWLVTNSEDTFNPESAQYFRLGKIANSDNVTIKNITKQFPQSSTEALYFTIWQAPEMFAHLDIISGKCKSHQESQVRFNMIGGIAPFQIQVKNLDKPSFSWQWKSTKNKDEKPLHLASGKYAYSITDAHNRQYMGEVYISDDDAPKPTLNQEYLVKNPIVLNPNQELPQDNYAYEWYREGVLVSQKPTYLLHQPGNYELRLRNASGCQSVTAFKALNTEENHIQSEISLYPNPSKDGYFKVMASFPKTTSGLLQVYTGDGRLITQQVYYNESQWLYDGHLSVSGVYFIKIQSSLGTETKKLIVR